MATPLILPVDPIERAAYIVSRSAIITTQLTTLRDNLRLGVYSIQDGDRTTIFSTPERMELAIAELWREYQALQNVLAGTTPIERPKTFVARTWRGL